MRYIPTIGLEVHAQLNTKTKIFCSCKTSFGNAPNVNTCPVCLALPGALPVLNKEALDKALIAGLAIKANIHNVSKFDRKNYFYPDLPKAYQITQMHMPYCTMGHLFIEKENGTKKKINITRIHMEEDAGKLMHSEDPNISESYVDLNRAGTPLIEIVSEPELDDSEEAYLYLAELKSILEYIGVSDCNMEQGSLRCDANISIRPEGTTTLGTRAEIKNLNSFKGVRAAIEYEILRQTDILNTNGEVKQETRLWNATTNQTFAMRSKEEAHDYRYFPDPDLVPVILSNEEIQKAKSSLPELAKEKQIRFVEQYELPSYDAQILTMDKTTANYFEETVKLGAGAKKTSNWMMAEMMAVKNEKHCELIDLFSPKHLAALVNEIESGKISGKIGKDVFAQMIETKEMPNVIIEKKGLSQISDKGAITKLVDEVIGENQESVDAYKAGKDNALKHLMGQVMKKSRGKANPPLVNKLLLERLK